MGDKGRDTEILDTIVDYLSVAESSRTMIKLLYGRFGITRQELVDRFSYSKADVDECCAEVDDDADEIPGIIIT